MPGFGMSTKISFFAAQAARQRDGEGTILYLNILSTHIKAPPRVNNTHKKRIKIEQINNLANKTIANRDGMVYACMRYPILVWHTVLVQNI